MAEPMMLPEVETVLGERNEIPGKLECERFYRYRYRSTAISQG